MSGIPFGKSAVMAATHGLTRCDDDDQTAHWRRLQFFPTPPWAARAGLECVRSLYDPRKPIGWPRRAWEPACGDGHMGESIRDELAFLRMSDVHDYGRGYEVRDFLMPMIVEPDSQYDLVITNPPFPLASQFVETGLTVAPTVAILGRLGLIESVGRYDLMSQLTLFCPFAERVPFRLGKLPGMKAGTKTAETTATAYAWFIWDQQRVGERRFRIIPPGTRARLWRPEDTKWRPIDDDLMLG